MFSGIRSILFGRSSGDSQREEEILPIDSQLTTSPLEDSDWLFVDRSDLELSEASSETLEGQRLTLSTASTPSKSDSSNASGSEEMSDFERFRGPFLSMQEIDPQSDTALSDVSSQPEHVTHPSLDECWIVTPPPCFTASKSNSDDVIQMHPLENLLIEHPSMSVYWPQKQLRVDSDDDLIVGTAEMPFEGPNYGDDETQTVEDYCTQGTFRIVDDQFGSDISQVHVFRPCLLVPESRCVPEESGRLRRNHGDSVELLICKSWSVEEEKGRKWLTSQNNSRKFLYQQNLVHEFSSHGKIRPRKDRMIYPSGRSSNRKC